MNKNYTIFEDLGKKPNKFIIFWWRLLNFIDSWIYPGHYTKNLLFHRYNVIKLPMFKPYEYLDVSVRMQFGIFELIKEFVEGEPEKYICWYADKITGEELGHKYGENEDKVLFSSLKNKYIMDIIKDIYKFYTKTLPELEMERKYLLHVWCRYIVNGHYENSKEDKDLLEWVEDKTNYMLKDLEKEDINWSILLKYIETKERFFEDDLIHAELHKLEKMIDSQIQYYLHLAIEVRPYLWV